MPHSPSSSRIGTARARAVTAGFGRGHPRVPTIISAGIVVALIAALVVAGASLTSELVQPAAFEEGADPETLALSGTVLLLILGLAGLLVGLLRRFLAADRTGSGTGLAA